MQTGLLKIGELAKHADVSIATLKHYLREGLIAPAKKTGRTMSWYAPTQVARVKAIKELQQRQFLPLDVIKRSLARDAGAPDELAAATAIAAVLDKHRGERSLTRAELLERGVDARELAWLAAAKLAVPVGDDDRYLGDDLALLTTLGTARKAGISPTMLPFSILAEYLAALRRLVEIELQMFRAGVLARADRDAIPALTTAATELSERLVILLRRKLLLPTLAALVQETRHEATVVDPDARRLRDKLVAADGDDRRSRRTDAAGGRRTARTRRRRSRK